MQASKENRLINLTMFCSMVLLLGFVLQWLSSQFNQQKNLLKQDISYQFGDIQNAALDSALLLNWVKPLLQSDDSLRATRFEKKRILQKKSKGSKTIVREWKDSANQGIFIQYSDSLSGKDKGNKNKVSQQFSFTIDTHSDDTPPSERPKKGKNDSLVMAFSYVNSEVGTPKKRLRTSDQDSAMLILMKGIKVLAKGFGDANFNSEETNFSFKTDSKALLVALKSKLEKQNKHFDLQFVAGSKNLNENANQFYLTIKPVLPDKNASEDSLLVSATFSYLLWQIAPQIAFALLLLLLVAASFYLARRFLSKQQELAEIKNSLIANISHELKTPISTVKVALEALQNFQVLQNPKQSEEYIGMAQHEINRLELLVNQVLNTALFEQGKLTFHKEECNFDVLVDAVCTHFQVKFKSQQMVLNLDIEAGNYHCEIDKLHIQGVLINLLDNALKYAAPASPVTIRLHHNNKLIRLEVSDMGPGIPNNFQNKVFEKFFRVPTGNLHSVKGYGLGLSYARDVVEQHQGALWVKNNPESGCTFYLQLNTSTGAKTS